MRFQCPKCRSTISGEIGDAADCSLCREKVETPASRVAPGAVIGDFVIVREIGRGGNGIVYLARQISLDRPVALKVLQEHYGKDPEFVGNFIREARAAARISHPNIVQAYAVGEDEGVYYFAMEYIDGETMKQVLKRESRIPPKRAAEIIEQIAEAIDFAWNEQHLVHQDIKPDNIMLTKRGQAKLADLGLARIVSGDTVMDDDDEVMGTPQYISPEQLTGIPTDTRSDIYSLGATFFHMVTGRFPYVGRDGNEIARQHVEGTFTRPIEIVREIPPEIDRIITKMMAKDIIERYQSAHDIAVDLKAFLRDFQKPAAAAPAPAPAPAPAAETAPGSSSQLGGVRPVEGLKLGESRNAGSKLASVTPGLSPSQPGLNPTSAAAPAPAPAAAPAAKPTIVKPSIVARPGAKPTAAPAPKPAAAPAPAPAPTPAPAAAPAPAPAAAPVKPPVNGKKTGMVLKSNEEEKPARSAPPMVAQIAQELEAGPKRDFTWLKKLLKILLGILIGIVILIGAAVAVAYILDQKDRVPESMKPHATRLLTLFKLKKPAEAGGENGTAEGEPAKDGGETATGSTGSTGTATTTAPVEPAPPRIVTRPAYLQASNELVSFIQSNPQKTAEFLDRVDDFLLTYPQPVTPEEEAALNRVMLIYGPHDNRLRVAPARRDAIAAQDRLLARRKAEAETRRKEEEDRRAAQQAALEELRKQSEAAATAIATRDEALKQELVERTRQYGVTIANERVRLVDTFFDTLDRSDDAPWRESRERIARLKADLPVNATAEERKLLNDFTALDTGLDAEFTRCRTLYGILNDPAKVSELNVELPRSRMVVCQSFADGVFQARTGSGDPVELPMSNNLYRRRVLARLERKFEFPHAMFYYSLLFKEFGRMTPDQLPNSFARQKLLPLVGEYLRGQWEKADQAGRDALLEKYGRHPALQRHLR